MFNAFTGKEATCYYIKTLSSNICAGAEILLDMLTGSRFDQEEMDKERKVICEEIKMVKDSPDDDVYDTISELVASGNPLGRSILGTPESLAGIDRAKLTAYYSEKYARDSIVIAVAGNFDEERIAELFESRLTSLREKKVTQDFTLKPYRQELRRKGEGYRTDSYLPCDAGHFHGGRQVLRVRADEQHIRRKYEFETFPEYKRRKGSGLHSLLNERVLQLYGFFQHICRSGA